MGINSSCVFLMGIFLILLGPIKVFADDVLVTPNNELKTVSDEVMRERVKKKLYLGGRDEDPLRVQAPLVNPVRKIIGTDEAGNEPAAND